jgi:hypothetical protein
MRIHNIALKYNDNSSYSLFSREEYTIYCKRPELLLPPSSPSLQLQQKNYRGIKVTNIDL